MPLFIASSNLELAGILLCSYINSMNCGSKLPEISIDIIYELIDRHYLHRYYLSLNSVCNRDLQRF